MAPRRRRRRFEALERISIELKPLSPFQSTRKREPEREEKEGIPLPPRTALRTRGENDRTRFSVCLFWVLSI
jgi:hypothetical protein